MIKTTDTSIYIRIPFMWISVNEAFAWYSKRHKSDKYKEFENKMEAFFLKENNNLEIFDDNWLSVNYRFYFKIYNNDWTKKIKDAFNYEKALTDVLTKHIKGFKDHKIKGWSCWKFDSEEEYMEIEIKELI